jgi:uncharacterized protein (DUF697 family)
MATQLQKVHGIIHIASAACAGVGAGLAQIPGSDMPVIAGLQTTMIVGIAEVHGVSLTKTAAADLLLTFTASVGGRALSQLLVGWVPGLGNAINASTAAALTEAVGWAAHTYFAKSDEERPGVKEVYSKEQAERQRQLVAEHERSLESLERSGASTEAIRRETATLKSARDQLKHMLSNLGS